MTARLAVFDVGVMPYRAAWDYQLSVHERVQSGDLAGGAIMFVEHPAVVTVGRHPGSAAHLLATPELLESRSVELVETDRGGDITFHGPGQLVAYPIIPLNSYGLNLHAYMRLMETVVIGVLAGYGIAGERSTGATGVWVGEAKVCAMGIKVRRWITLHGLALNVTTDLSYFDLINPCGLGRPVTSLERLLGTAPEIGAVKNALVQGFESALDQKP